MLKATMTTKVPGFSGFPEEDSYRRYRNIVLQFKKTIQSSKNFEELRREMEHFLNANRQVVWPHHTSGVFRKDEAEKAVDKVLKEYERYVGALKKHMPNTNPQDLLNALAIVESMLDQLKGQ